MAGISQMTEREKLKAAKAWLLERLYTPSSPANTALKAVEDAIAALPKTKMIEVWHVEYVVAGLPQISIRMTKADAERSASPSNTLTCSCVRVTGPHMHEVPDDRT